MAQLSDRIIALEILQSAMSEHISTLGPEGTSSEAAARAFAAHLTDLRGDRRVRVGLYDRYEAAGDALRAGEASLLVVANAYADIAQFYMDPDLRLVAAFVHDTPHYGIAARSRESVPRSVRVASHPAPTPLISQLLPPDFHVAEVRHVDSTSAAAAELRKRAVDLALTTVPAAKANELEFITPTRPIRMVWSVFRNTTEVPARRPGSVPAPRGRNRDIAVITVTTEAGDDQ